MTYEELLQLENVEVFITSDQQAFVFTIETYDEELDDISIKYYKVSKNSNGQPIVEKLNNTIELLLINKTSDCGLKLIKLQKEGPEDEEKRNEFINLITTIETGKSPRRNIQQNTPYFTPVSSPTLKLLKQR